MQIQGNTEMYYRRGNRRTRRKTSSRPSKLKLIHQKIKLEYMNDKKPSKGSLPYVLEPSKLLLPTDFSEPCFLQLSGSHNLARLHPPSEWLLLILPSSTKFSLYTQYGCGRCLDQQPLKDLEMERQELSKTTRKCVKDCGYNNL